MQHQHRRRVAGAVVAQVQPDPLDLDQVAGTAQIFRLQIDALQVRRSRPDPQARQRDDDDHADDL
ncbi:hypothetical protein [Brevundimonas sp. TWP2-3-4b2]|uniref:hypothetical protein n=1 Tax=Brevundimonas sp. TWP2-3-4b2 TaxID=2804595 RepID=UPI003CF59B88